MRWNWAKIIAPKPEVLDAMRESKVRAEIAAEAKKEIAKRVAPLKRALKKNHFEQSVLTVMRRGEAEKS